MHHDRRALHSVLTAIAAGNDDVAAVVAQINHVTHGGEKCTSLAECPELLAGGADIVYDGVPGPLEFIYAVEPSSRRRYRSWSSSSTRPARGSRLDLI